MNLKKLENEVMINSILFEDKLPVYIKTHKDKYAVFNQGEIFFADSFKEGVNTGISQFGENIGFVVKKISKEMPILSSLVTL
ncbi:MAG: hypothetical protein CVV49_08505 [Spirochaetae bacterium HGW-Spirochaetae-5]|nr:MAG: hypothetical protein CVV49_08505 [Spirochaetae bacterium HGW-Spirochaetae-5]